MTSDPELIYIARPGYVAAGLGDDLALLDLANGVYLGFNATAAHVWRLLDKPRTLDAICEIMMGEFDIDAERCRQEVSKLLEALLTEGLIQANHGQLA